MITSITVHRKRHGISYIPRYYVPHLPDNANIISIVDAGFKRPKFGPNQNVLELTDYCTGLDGEAHQHAQDFLESLNGENVYIHCEMGQVRSKNLAHWLQRRFDRYRIAAHSTDFCVAHIIR